MQEYIESRSNQFEDKWDEKLVRLDAELRSFSDEIHTLANRFDTVYRDRELNLLAQINTLNKDVGLLSEARKNEQAEVTKLSQVLEKTKLKTSELVADLVNKLAEKEVVVVTKMSAFEEEIKSLVQSIEGLKQSALNLSNQTESKSVVERYRTGTFTSKYEESISKGYTSPTGRVGYTYKPHESVRLTLLIVVS